MQPPQIIGWAHSKFGKAPEEDVEQLLAGVIPEALQHSGVGPEEIDGIFVGVYNNGFSRQSFEGALAGMAVPALARVPSVHFGNACATGSAALYDRQAETLALVRLMNRQGCQPKRKVTDRLRSCGAARRQVMPDVERRSHKGLKNRAENSHPQLRKRERVMQWFRSAGALQRFVSVFSAVRNLFVPTSPKKRAIDVRPASAQGGRPLEECGWHRGVITGSLPIAHSSQLT